MGDPIVTTWRKSTYSNNGQCLEFADLGDHVGLRDSKDPAGPVLRLTREQLAGLLAGVRAGEFDDLV